MMHVRRTFSHALRLLTLTALLGASVAQADEYSDIQKLLRAGKPAEALTQTDQLLRAKPRDPQLRFLRGVALTQTGKRDQAIAVFTKLTQDYPELPEPYNNLAVLYAGQNQFDKARTALEMAIRTNPSYATAHENLGDVYARLASTAYNKALQLDGSQTASVQPKLELIQGLSYPAAVTPAPAPAVVASAAATTASKPAPAPNPAVAPVPAPPAPAPIASPTPAPAPIVAAPTPAPAPAVVAPADAAVVKAVTSAVQAWASAWSNKDLNAYFAAYAKDAVPSGKQSRKDWEAERRARISGKARISVALRDLNVRTEGDTATVRFRQDYSAGALQTSSRKTLEMRKVQGRWVILRENVGG